MSARGWPNEVDPMRVPTLNGIIAGMELSNSPGDVVNDLDISTGIAASDVLHNPYLMGISIAVTKRLDAAWAAGTNQGMRDSGDNLTGAKTFHIFAIMRLDNRHVDFFASTSLTPTLPSPYSIKRRLGSILWTGSAIREFIQKRNLFLLKSFILDVDLSGNQGTAAYLAALSVPIGIEVEAIFNAYQFDNTNTVFTLISYPGIPDVGASVTTAPLVVFGSQATGVDVRDQFKFLTNTSGQIRIRHHAVGSANFILRVSTIGWVDFL